MVSHSSLRTLVLLLTLSAPGFVACSAAPPLAKSESEAASEPATSGANAALGNDQSGAHDAALGRGEPTPKSDPAGSGGADRDHDDILDANDSCPDEPEDRDGFEDSNGCPDPDNDKDGLRDTDDRCPNDAETMNGYQDEDGCPDVKK